MLARVKCFLIGLWAFCLTIRPVWSDEQVEEQVLAMPKVVIDLSDVALLIFQQQSKIVAFMLLIALFTSVLAYGFLKRTQQEQTIKDGMLPSVVSVVAVLVVLMLALALPVMRYWLVGLK
ncbi:hypothetical protein [Agitococcus lubricus]|uniref:Uncharacterized protein n=1 Tax=Agitococcus lubricus TaxID=1077255 RepID=A0A2T5J2N4_9GAMM|nr:hypothetical protein [Agitococcus lubricus]PTQ90778.1 hypothetical protein C8N29_102178 [Agitococcus lubricus]